MDMNNLYERFVERLNSITDDELRESLEKAREESRDAYLMDDPDEYRLIIPLGDYQIVAEISDVDPDVPNELWVYIRNKNKQIIQDICTVRPHFDYIRSKGEFETDNDFVDCLVWGESGNEDYTDKHVIGVYKEEDEE